MLAGCFEGGIPSALDVMIIRDDVPDMVVYRSRPDLARADFGATVPASRCLRFTAVISTPRPHSG